MATFNPEAVRQYRHVKSVVNAYVNIGGILKQIAEVWMNIDGVLKRYSESVPVVSLGAITPLSVARYSLAATSNGTHMLFGGGIPVVTAM